MKKTNKHSLAIFLLAISSGLSGLGHANAAESERSEPVFAKVNGEVITEQTFLTALRAGGRQRFYHGKAPEPELVAFRQEIANKLIDERLLHQEALRREITPDAAWVDAEFAKIEKRYSASPQWSAGGEALASDIRSGLEQRSRIRLLEAKMSEVAEPNEAELRHYYESFAEKFTSPEQIKVSTILLSVEPWQPKDVWDDTRAKADEIHAAIAAGAGFDDYAQQYPPNKQQMGYIHRGMLGEGAQDAIDKLQPGGISEVVTLLEGIAIFRLDERQAAKLNPLDRVRDRAVQLWKRERREQVKNRAMQALRDRADIELTNPDFHLVSSTKGKPIKQAEGSNSQTQ